MTERRPMTERKIRIMRRLQKGHMFVIAGKYMAGEMAAARGLVRDGYLLEVKTAQFALTSKGKEFLEKDGAA